MLVDREDLVMNSISVDLENCYGIRSFKANFDFSNDRVFALYAPNGFMKTSFAQVFTDLSKGNKPKDRIFPERVTICNVKDESGKQIDKKQIFVVGPLDSRFDGGGNIALLLVNETLRKEYQTLHQGVKDAKDALLKAIRTQADSKRDFEAEIARAFTPEDENFQKALDRIEKELKAQEATPFKDVRYESLFDEKLQDLLQSPEVSAGINGYVTRYNELLAASVYFRRGMFDYYNAAQIAKSLTSNGFFEAKHSVTLNGGTPKHIKTQKELEQVIDEEKKSILTDATLRKEFNAVSAHFNKNVAARDFQTYLMENEYLLPHLSNPKKLRAEILKSYLKTHFHLYEALLKEHSKCATRSKAIRKIAADEHTQWQSVIEEFNNRFHVPFTLGVKNLMEVMLEKEGAVVELAFTYKDGGGSKPVDKNSLVDSLSTGEKKALYILNVIFEIECRKTQGTETLIVIDDIADSFDYQNKYAILQYLKDNSLNPLFKQIIMTHNFDFFRTVEGRRLAGRNHCMMIVKTDSGITAIGAEGVQNVFKRWKENFSTDKNRKIGCIPFMRNLVEYTLGSQEKTFKDLTSLLHWKEHSMELTEAHLDTIYNRIFPNVQVPASGGSSKPMIEVILEEAEKCVSSGNGGLLESKVTMSIAIRILAEKFMVKKISDDAWWKAITNNQTGKMFGRYVTMFGRHAPESLVLDRVMLMTPENIHLNSFMYEPIVDLSHEHLCRLYSSVVVLT
jgi:hypothetical protein